MGGCHRYVHMKPYATNYYCVAAAHRQCGWSRRLANLSLHCLMSTGRVRAKKNRGLMMEGALLQAPKYQSGAGCDGRLGDFTYHLEVGSFKLIAGLTVVNEARRSK